MIILAAGSSSRLGRPKQLLKLDGETLIRRAAQTALASICRPVVVVLGAHARNIKPHLTGLRIATVTNRQWELGMGSSIKTGLQTLAAVEAIEGQKTNGVLLMLADQPLVTPVFLNELALSYMLHGRIVASSYNDTLGVPAVFDKRYHGELCNLSPNGGAKGLIQNHADEVDAIKFPDGAVDIDTEDDYKKLQLTRHAQWLPPATGKSMDAPAPNGVYQPSG